MTGGVGFGECMDEDDKLLGIAVEEEGGSETWTD